jgi:hypothetical protein
LYSFQDTIRECAFGESDRRGRSRNAAVVPSAPPISRPAPEHPYPAAVDDAEACYRWLADSPGDLVLVGDASGADHVFSPDRLPGKLARLSESRITSPATPSTKPS